MISMRGRTYLASCAAVAALCVAGSPSASADEWNERTILTFSDPVMIPGATLQPGTYEFRLANTRADRHIVQVFTQGGEKIVASMIAVPIKRAEVTEDVVVKFNPTDVGTPPAMKGWFYPGSQFGHEFVYPEEQARQIAERTKTIVLSIDTPGADVEKGVLRTYSASGARAEWRGDAATLKEWEAWRQRGDTAKSADTTPAERKQATAPAVRSDFQATRVELDDLEANTARYIGQTVSVDGEVEEVLGPRVFTIDEPNWGDLDGEILVFMPSHLVALIQDDDLVTVTGTVRPFVRAEFGRELDWFKADPDFEVDLQAKPVLVAERIVGGDDDVAFVIELDPATPVGTGGNAAPPIDSLEAVARADDELIGRQVELDNVTVTSVAQDGGFFIESGGDVLFVLPADADASVRAGEMVSIDGVILQLPDRMEDRLQAPDGLNGKIYVFARQLGR